MLFLWHTVYTAERLALQCSRSSRTDLIAAILEETDEQDCHHNDDGDEDSCIDQSKPKRLYTTGRRALVKRKVVPESCTAVQ